MTLFPTRFLVLLTIVIVLVGGPTANACSVCFGDPNSAMAKGAAMGVWVLGGVISFVLFIVGGTSLFWVRRGRLLSQSNAK